MTTAAPAQPSAIQQLLDGLGNALSDPNNAATLGMAQGLLQASAPHLLTKVPMGQALGMGAAASQQYQNEALQNAMLRQTVPFQGMRVQSFMKALQTMQDPKASASDKAAAKAFVFSMAGAPALGNSVYTNSPPVVGAREKAISENKPVPVPPNTRLYGPVGAQSVGAQGTLPEGTAQPPPGTPGAPAMGSLDLSFLPGAPQAITANAANKAGGAAAAAYPYQAGLSYHTRAPGAAGGTLGPRPPPFAPMSGSPPASGMPGAPPASPAAPSLAAIRAALAAQRQRQMGMVQGMQSAGAPMPGQQPPTQPPPPLTPTDLATASNPQAVLAAHQAATQRAAQAQQAIRQRALAIQQAARQRQMQGAPSPMPQQPQGASMGQPPVGQPPQQGAPNPQALAAAQAAARQRQMGLVQGINQAPQTAGAPAPFVVSPPPTRGGGIGPNPNPPGSLAASQDVWKTPQGRAQVAAALNAAIASVPRAPVAAPQAATPPQPAARPVLALPRPQQPPAGNGLMSPGLSPAQVELQKQSAQQTGAQETEGTKETEAAQAQLARLTEMQNALTQIPVGGNFAKIYAGVGDVLNYAGINTPGLTAIQEYTKYRTNFVADAARKMGAKVSYQEVGYIAKGVPDFTLAGNAPKALLAQLSGAAQYDITRNQAMQDYATKVPNPYGNAYQGTTRGFEQWWQKTGVTPGALMFMNTLFALPPADRGQYLSNFRSTTTGKVYLQQYAKAQAFMRSNPQLVPFWSAQQ